MAVPRYRPTRELTLLRHDLSRRSFSVARHDGAISTEGNLLASRFAGRPPPHRTRNSPSPQHVLVFSQAPDARTFTMSHRFALSLRSLAARPTVSPSQVAFLAQRNLSTSPILRLATQSTPQTGPTVPGYAPPPQAPIVPKAQQTVADYSKGPSALDKAASLFFFTEILRGECRIAASSWDCRSEPTELMRFALAGWSNQE